ncbi:unnamed protein product [Rotaria sp. Silwood2]|nr:unnamed protein product [Rotaria sp. Silwood2]CAF2902330.1 unnamed protein product [Rotaria sp. Silwood2]CAF3950547.1 unnamed protein product [Rotaria sp. Silwood2]CAF3972431.1 unnamed protein product [Rotaria sp. Silwood2]CAF4265051.1 unnamed protein product [Rotaria sp. Silwood2]
MRFIGTEEHESYNGSGTYDPILNENVIMENRNSTSPSWVEPISCDLKENCLKQFLHRMSMSALAETTCAVCSVRIPAQKSKSVLISKRTNSIELLKVSDETNALIMNTQLSNQHHINHDTVTTVNSDGIQMIDNVQSISTSKSLSFYCENNIILYAGGLFQQNNVNMCRLCQKFNDALSKGRIPKFSAGNGVWLDDVPAELQDLAIPEEKLISLYRHNSCVLKLQSPFHSATTSQTALKGNCITFIQNISNIVDSLPLKLDDLCDTLKVIFVGSRPPERIHLRKNFNSKQEKNYSGSAMAEEI